MTVKLIKRNQEVRTEKQAAQAPTLNQMLSTTKSWVDEFRNNKARNDAALLQLVKSN